MAALTYQYLIVNAVPVLLILLQLASPGGSTGTYGPVAFSHSPCREPIVRKEWRTLSVADRKSYISAVKCLMKKPALTSVSDIPGVSNRYEDFLGTHIVQATNIHFVGIFYPWHRLMLVVYEKMMQSCGYSGAQPYWDWTLDGGSLAKFSSSPVFDTVTGFGGNGEYVPGNFSNPQQELFVGAPWDLPDRTGGGCISDGPFKDWIVKLGPGTNINPGPHCVRRDFAPITFTNMTSSASVAEGMSMPDFGLFSSTTEFSAHGGGHLGVGGLYGTMSDQWSSPSDPIFYLHHANLDRLWWSWQSKDPNARLSDISGPLVQFDYANQQGENATLDTKIRLGQSVNITLTVRDVMNIQGDLLCYKYDKLYV
ncbi:hypothetical protein BKA66DRAFT_459432 [Pyrenochaeta sp. MPI-SDFR-AT-0127]|nr:hypothetical protein BKA66DRAFT_459432 [Pyrenochaeta sp. MPI-SDFR-AT-0127]